MRWWGWLILGALAVFTAHRVPDWKDDLTLWRAAVDQTPWKPRPLVNYRTALLKSGQYLEAVQICGRALQAVQDPRRTAIDRSIVSSVCLLSP